MNQPFYLLPPPGALIDSPGHRRPLENTPTRLVNYGKEAVVTPDEPPIDVFNTEVRCSVGEILAVVFGVAAADGSSQPFAPMGQNGVRPLDPRDPMVLLRAIVTGGLGCTRFEITFDIRKGTVFALPTETVKVQAYALTVMSPNIPREQMFCPPDVVVSAGVGYGCGREFARLTEPVRVAANAQGDVPVPEYASRFTLVPSGSSTLRVEAVVGGGGPYPVYEATGPSPAPVMYPIPNGTRSLRVFGPAEGFLLFGLDL